MNTTKNPTLVSLVKTNLTKTNVIPGVDVTLGEVLVSSIFLSVDTDTVKQYDIDCHSKYPEFWLNGNGYYTSDGDGNDIDVADTSVSLYLYATPQSPSEFGGTSGTLNTHSHPFRDDDDFSPVVIVPNRMDALTVFEITLPQEGKWTYFVEGGRYSLTLTLVKVPQTHATTSEDNHSAEIEDNYYD